MGPLRILRQAGRWTEQRLADLYESLTEGQRWTSGLALALAAVIGLFGIPGASVVVSSPRGGPTAHADASAPREESAAATSASSPVAPHPAVAVAPPEGAPPPPPAPPLSPSSPPPASEPSPPTDPGFGPGFGPGLGAGPGPGLGGAVRVAALVRADDSGLPNRDDEAIAGTALQAATFDATVVPFSADGEDAEAVCADAAGFAAVLTGGGLPAALRSCLVEQGAAVVADDDGGSVVASETGRPFLSSRPGVGLALERLAEWGAGEALAGTVGVVGTESSREAVSEAVERMRAAGVDVAVVHFVDEDASSPAASVLEGVRAFQQAEAEVTVFALATRWQRLWVALEPAALRAPPRYVVADVADAVTDEEYPPVFHGALSLTTRTVPWGVREDGESPAQTSCRERWEATARTTLGTGELVRLLAWCQAVAVLQAAVDRAADGAVDGASGGGLGEALAATEAEGLLTTQLGPWGAGAEQAGWGPQVDHLVEWQAPCGCWALLEGAVMDRRSTAGDPS